ncbi:hypothetical protein KC19_12G084800 [Ceratodon purpureus]|uniref:Uncharacterized protein n=1 Tax=Ceratodon purpureus TaxID=3225 RepID=A0A8T0G901_CERPU|nr:hypothetical protein KC19_12G084800 [Ceratodon purpureus]
MASMDWISWNERLKSLVEVDEQRGRIKAKLLDKGPEYAKALFADTDGAVRASLLALIEPAGAGYGPIPGTQEQLLFWKNLEKAELKSETVSIDMEVDQIPGNQDADMEVDKIDVIVTTLELQDNSTFMGVQGGMSRIMVPKFYNDLWEKAELLIDGDTPKKKGMVITGTPGTGKSVMGWYFIFKLREKLGSFDLVYQHEGMQTFYCKNGAVTSAGIAARSFSRVLSRKDTVYVVDGVSVFDENAMTFVFASPNPKGYNVFLKRPGTGLYYSKVWSKIEILAAREQLYKHIEKSSVLDLYRKWGGVPRYVLERAEDRNFQIHLDSMIESVSGDDWLDFMTKVGGQGRTKISDVIFHFRTEDYVLRTVDFASFYVSELAYTKLQKSAWAKTVDFLERDDSASAAFRGQLFETAAHEMLLRKCRVRVRSLEENGQSETVDWPELQRRKFRKLTDVKGEGSAGCYWKPESKTNATFDAVCTSIGAPLGTSAALQMTISEEHGIKHDGLDKLLRAIPFVKRFYWVVPALIFEDFKKQKFKNKDSEPRTQAISYPVSEVEQWALELPLNHLHPGAVQS